MQKWTAVLLLGSFVAAGCNQTDKNTAGKTSVLRLAVTTSTRDSGLLDTLVPLFEKERGVRVDVIAVGTGAALKLGESGDVDVVLVHAREAEDAFMVGGYGARREDVMYNTFEIIGPRSDPAKIKNMPAARALEKIASGKHKFASRGDNSGTHQRELLLWTSAGGRVEWKGYVESGQGMGATLIMANQMQAYTLTDRGTYLKFKQKIELVPLAASSESLKNPYGIIVVNADNHAGVNQSLAELFVDFIISPTAQRLIGDYKIEGEQLFHPLRLPGEG